MFNYILITKLKIHEIVCQLLKSTYSFQKKILLTPEIVRSVDGIYAWNDTLGMKKCLQNLIFIPLLIVKF